MTKNSLTIRDIARMANVSHTTVSRVLNNDPRVQEKTKNRILSLVKKLGFKPDARARNLALKKSKLIGLVVTDIRNPFYADLARGIEDKAHQLGYNVIFCSTDHKPERLDSYINLMLDVGVDGFIFASSRLSEPAVERLIEARFPLVLVNRKLKREDYNYVVLDNFKGAYDITKHLIDLGYRKIAIIDGPANVFTGLERLKGYQRAIKDHDICFKPEYVFQGTFARATGYEGATQLLKMRDKPEAIFGGSDYIAMGVIDAIEELGLKIPEDVALVGFDDTEFASNRRILLTTVSQREYTMGGLGVKILIDCIENKEAGYVHKVVLESKLIVRESCGYRLRARQGQSGAGSDTPDTGGRYRLVAN